MKTIAVQELPGPVSAWLRSIGPEGEVTITDQNTVIARFVTAPPPPPDPPRLPDGRIDWSDSYAFRDRTGERILTAEEAQTILDESRGSW